MPPSGPPVAPQSPEYPPTPPPPLRGLAAARRHSLQAGGEKVQGVDPTRLGQAANIVQRPASPGIPARAGRAP